MSNAPAHAARGHHPYSPSSLGNLERSPCFIGRSGNTEASTAGTRQHEAVDAAHVPEDMSDEHADAVDRALRMVAATKELLRSANIPFVELTEVYLPVDDEPIEGWTGTTGGYPDQVIIAREPEGVHIYVFDWKFGQYAVTPAAQNRQGHAYILGVLHRLSKGLVGPPDWPRYAHAATAVFFSPHRDAEPSQHEFTESDFPSLYNDVVYIVTNAAATRARIKSDGFTAANLSAFRTNVNTCAFCGNLAKCPAVRALADSIARKYKPAEIPEDFNGVGTTDMQAAANGLKIAAIVKSWAEAYRNRITEQAFESPETHTPVGYKLRSTNPIRVVDAPKLLEFLRERFGDERTMEHVDIPITPFDKLVGAAAPRGGKQAAVDSFREQLTSAGLIVPSPVPTVSLRME